MGQPVDVMYDVFCCDVHIYIYNIIYNIIYMLYNIIYNIYICTSQQNTSHITSTG